MIWIVGNRGMLGQELQATLAAAGLAFFGTDREVDFTDRAALDAWLDGQGAGAVAWIINCAAYTAVDKAEDEPELCRRLNVSGPATLAALARDRGLSLLHISTDYVFDGKGISGTDGQLRAYVESDPVNPVGVYAQTKADGESAVRAVLDRHVILRTAWLYGRHGPNFVYTMLRLMRSRDAIGVVADQWGSPTWARDLANAVLAIVSHQAPQYGTYQFTHQGATNWHSFATEIFRLGTEYGIIDHPVTINALTTEQYPTKAQRPAWSVLDKAKISADYGVSISRWQNGLQQFFAETFRFVDDIRGYAKMAEYDLDTAKAMLDSARYLYVADSCQQAIEKNLKSLISSQDCPGRIHNLAELVKQAGIELSEWMSLLDILSMYYLKGRNPAEFATLLHGVDQASAQYWYEGTVKVCEKIRKHPLFSLW